MCWEQNLSERPGFSDTYRYLSSVEVDNSFLQTKVTKKVQVANTSARISAQKRKKATHVTNLTDIFKGGFRLNFRQKPMDSDTISALSPNGFRRSWLNLPKEEGLSDWLDYNLEKDAVFCSICRRAKSTGLSTLFSNDKGYTGGKKKMKLSDLKEHSISKSHKRAKEVLQQRSSIAALKDNMKRIQKDRLETQQLIDLNSWYPYALQCSYFLAKNNLSYDLQEDLCWFVQTQIKNATGKDFELGYGSYTNDKAAREMIASFAMDIESDTTSKIKEAKYFTLMIDESTDISTSKNLIMMVRFAEKGQVVTKLLDIVAVTCGKAEAIQQAITDKFSKAGLDFKDLVGFSSDGASVMTGNNSGVASRLKSLNPVVVDTHCAAHRLQLAIQDAVSDFEDFFIGLVKSTSAYFSKSTARKLALKINCEDLDEKFYQTLRTIDTRWLSLGNSLKNLMQVYTPLMITFREDIDSELAKTLAPYYEDLGFKYWIAFMDDICNVLNNLSRSLQKSDLNVVDVLSRIINCANLLHTHFFAREWDVHPS